MYTQYYSSYACGSVIHNCITSALLVLLSLHRIVIIFLQMVLPLLLTCSYCNTTVMHIIVTIVYMHASKDNGLSQYNIAAVGVLDILKS